MQVVLTISRRVRGGQRGRATRCRSWTSAPPHSHICFTHVCRLGSSSPLRDLGRTGRPDHSLPWLDPCPTLGHQWSRLRPWSPSCLGDCLRAVPRPTSQCQPRNIFVCKDGVGLQLAASGVRHRPCSLVALLLTCPGLWRSTLWSVRSLLHRCLPSSGDQLAPSTLVCYVMLGMLEIVRWL